MPLTEKQIFIESPFQIGIFTSVLTAVILAILLGIFAVVFGKVSPASKLSRMGIKTMGGVVLFIALIFSIVMLILWLTLSFMKKQTIICDGDGCLVLSKSFWEKEIKEIRFNWNEVTGTKIRTGYKGVKSFVVNVKGKELRLMDKNLFNRKEFRNLISVFSDSTTHLEH